MNSPDSSRQREHYDRIIDDYESHYFDTWSLRYRERFIHDFLLDGLSLDGKRVADLACGAGHTSLALRNRFPGIRTEGFDISPRSCERYTSNTGEPAHEVDLTKPLTADFGTFDAAIIIGGLHHCVTDLPQAFKNIRSLLKPGGQLLMMEPNGLYVLEGARRWWYRADSHFDAETEQALRHRDLIEMASPDFRCDRVRHLGGPAYFAVLNSLILRVPLKAKAFIAPPLLLMERLWNLLPTPLVHAIFISRWVRTDD